jgi:hypothetical protein
MEQLSAYEEEQIWRNEVRKFSRAVRHHFVWFIGSSTLAVLLACGQSGGFVLPPLVYWLIVISGIPIACFLAWREERRAKENVLRAPNIFGTWFRNKYPNATGILNVSFFDGGNFNGIFREGTIDHIVEGYYDPNNKRFNVTTSRIDINDPAKYRFLQNEIYYMPDNDTLWFHCDLNFNNEEEMGVLKRRF